jgi:hypothetical protein
MVVLAVAVATVIFVATAAAVTNLSQSRARSGA